MRLEQLITYMIEDPPLQSEVRVEKDKADRGMEGPVPLRTVDVCRPGPGAAPCDIQLLET